MKRVQLIIHGFEVMVAFDENSIHVFNAFPIKDELKLHGYRWNPLQKSWDFSGTDVSGEMARLQAGEETPVEKPVPDSHPSGEFPDSLSVSQLRERIHNLIRLHLPATIWVRGIIASEPKNYRWATYFDLRDEADGLDMVFSSEIRTAEEKRIRDKLAGTGVAEGLEKDLPVFVRVEVTLSLKYTVNVRLRVVDILPEYTRERLRSQRDVTVDRLKREGLLDLQKSLPLPMLIRRVGLITSALGTSVRDIRAGLSPLESRYDFMFVDTRMEGGRAVDGVIATLDYFENEMDEPPDVVAIARGGGSEQSLSVFNDYRLCARICRATIPVLTAIGHEKDRSAAEICSHFTPTPSTPSGMGGFFRDRFVNLQDRLGDQVHRLVDRFSERHQLETERVRSHSRQIPRQVFHHLTLAGMTFSDRMRSFQREGLRLTASHRTNLLRLNSQWMNRSRSIRKREALRLVHTTGRIDFPGRFRRNGESVAALRRMSGQVREASLRCLDRGQVAVNARRDLARASHPDRILEYGFTLTLDPRERVVKTAASFRSMKRARLRFADGTEWIERKEDE